MNMRKEIIILILIVAVAFLSLGGYLLYSNWKVEIMKIPPKAPGELVAIPTSAIQVKLTWKDNSINENGFLLYRDGEKVVELQENTRSFIDNGRRPATSYRYEIKAYNQAGESDVAMCSVKTLNPPIQIWLEQIGVHECGEEGESFRELWDIMRQQPVTGEIQVGFVATDGKRTLQTPIPNKDYIELKQDDVVSVTRLLFETKEVGDYLRLFATAYEQDGGFKEDVIYKVLDIATGSYIGTPTSILLTLSGVDFSKIYADIFGAEDDWLGSYVYEWNSSNNWGIGEYTDVECKRDNGNVGLRLWFRVVCPIYDYSSEKIPPQ